MAIDKSGKELERFVQFVEGVDLPEGFRVETNRKIRNAAGDDEAEFDIVIEGDLGTARFAWLIECRDRPSSGPAPASWIEQLIGRRSRFNFNKVTAASTTGFSAGARRLAKEAGIDIRSVKHLSEVEFSQWLTITTYEQIIRYAELEHANLVVDDDLDIMLGYALQKKMANLVEGEKFLISIRDGTKHEPKDAFLGVIELNGLFGKLDKDDHRLSLKIGAKYINPDDCFGIETELGIIKIRQIEFKGFIFQKTTLVPLASIKSYSDGSPGKEFSQTATYAPQDIGGRQLALTLHKNNLTGETTIFLVPEVPRPETGA